MAKGQGRAAWSAIHAETGKLVATGHINVAHTTGATLITQAPLFFFGSGKDGLICLI